MLPKEIERHRADKGEIHWGIAITQRREILFQDHIFDPMEAIFNVPMLPHVLSKACGIQRERTDLEHRFAEGLVRSGAHPFHANDSLHTDPLRRKGANTV